MRVGKKYCPDYDIVRVDESNFDFSQNRYAKEAYEAKKYAFVTDYVRLKLLYDNGGIYFDTDVEVLKSFDDLLGYSGFAGFEKSYFSSNKNEYFIATGLGIGSEPKNPFIKKMLDDYSEIGFLKDDKFDLKPCTERNTESLITCGLKPNNELQIIDNFLFAPKDYFVL